MGRPIEGFLVETTLELVFDGVKKCLALYVEVDLNISASIVPRELHSDLVNKWRLLVHVGGW